MPEVARLGHGEEKGLRGIRMLMAFFGGRGDTKRRSEIYHGDGDAAQSTTKGTELCALNGWTNEM